MSRKSIRPSNRVQVGESEIARVRRCGRRRQGGAWVPAYEVEHSNGAIRTLGADLVGTRRRV